MPVPEVFAPILPDWPMYGWVDDVRTPLQDAVARGARSVLATLHAVVGGSPRPAGSQMLIVEDELYGFLSGGCIESDVAMHARETLRTGEPKRLVYGDGGAFADIRLVCGGRVDILLERIEPRDDAVLQMLKAYAAREPVLWASDGRSRVCRPDGPPARTSGACFADQALRALQDAPQAACVSLHGGRSIAVRYAPMRRLAVVGHDPTAMAIAALGVQSGFDVHLIRPKGPSEGPPLTSVSYHRGGIAEAFSRIGLDRWTCVAVATHGVELDEEALVLALPSQAAYVGVLGAKRRLPERMARLRALGVTAEELTRLHAPIGLDIGAKAPFEIAVSVIGEVMANTGQSRPSESGCASAVAPAAA